MTLKNSSNWRQALSLLGQLGYVIAIPLVILALAGRFLDKKLNTSPWLLIVGMLFALTISTFWVYRKTADIMKDAVENKKTEDKQ